MRLATVLMMSISSVLVSCGHKAPPPPKEIHYGFYINNGTPYVRLLQYGTNKVIGNYRLSQDNSMGYVCTPRAHFEEAYTYAQKLQKYVLALEKDIEQCGGK